MLKIYKKIEEFALKIIEKLENQKITLFGWLISFFAVVFVRNLLESFSTRNNFFFPGSHIALFFHTTTFFLLITLFIVLVLHLLTKEKIEKITKLALFAFLIVLLPPIVDLVITGGEGGLSIQYRMFVEPPENIFDFFQLFLKLVVFHYVPFAGQDLHIIENVSKINYGAKIEAGIVILGFIWYIFLKTKSILKVFLGFILFGLISFSIGTIPGGLYGTIASSINPSFQHHHVIFSLYLISICILISFWFYFYNKEKFFAFFKNARPTRVFHNIILLGLGIYLAQVPIFNPLSLNSADWLLIIIAIIAVLLYWFSAIGYDDLSDEKIDRISNSSRPLPQNKFTREEFKNINNLLRITAYIISFAVGYAFFIFILLRSLAGYLYYAFPFRLKRFPFLATFTDALLFLFTILAGFHLNPFSTIFDFPGKLAIFILIAFTLGSTVKDIKDYQGDKAEKIYTIPVIFGLENGKKIIGSLVFIAFILCPVFFFDYFNILILPAVFAGILSFFLINKKEPGKKEAFCLFLIYFSFGLFFILTCFNFIS